MKNVMKKVIIVAILAMVVMMMCGFIYETEEVPEALIEELEFEGFKQDATESNLWLYEEYIDLDEDGEHTYIFAWFDTDENVGIVTAQEYDADNHVIAICNASVSWNEETGDFDELAYFEREF